MIVQLTLGLALLLQNGLLMVYGGQPVRTPSAVESQLIIVGDVVMRLPHVIACGASFALAILLYVMLRATDFGRSIRAVHQNPHAAKLMGIDVARIQLLTFALSTASSPLPPRCSFPVPRSIRTRACAIRSSRSSSSYSAA
jgi:branched-chain amino acid transport system permease protein